ncbi:HTH domain-containing protein [Dysgonomonas termitidis]|uniref:HTH domain-containing protein n=1 Tax=Dysgonomonas termitidis TaxID=1516126 RepID=A0ABV9KVK7_9BACT
MSIFSTIERINQLHSLIKTGKTGNPKTLATHLSISRATLYNLLNELKTFGAPIIYSRAQKSFLYTREFNLELKCTIELIETDELTRINGGGYSFFLPFNFLDGRNILL